MHCIREDDRHSDVLFFCSGPVKATMLEEAQAVYGILVYCILYTVLQMQSAQHAEQGRNKALAETGLSSKVLVDACGWLLSVAAEYLRCHICLMVVTSPHLAPPVNTCFLYKVQLKELDKQAVAQPTDAAAVKARQAAAASTTADGEMLDGVAAAGAVGIGSSDGNSGGISRVCLGMKLEVLQALLVSTALAA